MARKKDKKSKSKSQFIISGLGSTETRRLIAKGPHTAKLIEVEPGEGDAGPYLGWKFQVTSGKYKGNSPRNYITTLAEGKLWNLKKVLQALGSEAADSDDDVNVADVAKDLIGTECVIIIGHREYEGRFSSEIVEFGDEDDLEESESEDDDEDDEDEKPAKKSGKKKKPADDDEEDDDDDDEDDDDDSDDDDDGDDEPSEESINAMDADELEEFCAEHDLEVDLPKKLSKARAAVVKAAKKAKLI